MTNAERIRQITDEELAMALSGNSCPPGDDLYELCSDYSDDGIPPEICKRCWIRWLQQEAKT